MTTFFKISELSKISGVHPETIRYYEKMRLLTPAQRQANGYRLFSQIQLNELYFIKTCRAIGFGLEATKQLLALQANPNSPCQIADELAQKQLTHIKEQIKQLQKIQTLLETLAHCPANDSEHCQIIGTIKNFDKQKPPQGVVLTD